MQIQYADGDREHGVSFVKYEMQPNSSGAQLVTVYDYKPGTYVAQTSQPSGDDAVPAASPGDDALPAGPADPPTNSAGHAAVSAEVPTKPAGDDADPAEEHTESAQGNAVSADAPAQPTDAAGPSGAEHVQGKLDRIGPHPLYLVATVYYACQQVPCLIQQT